MKIGDACGPADLPADARVIARLVDDPDTAKEPTMKQSPPSYVNWAVPEREHLGTELAALVADALQALRAAIGRR